MVVMFGQQSICCLPVDLTFVILKHQPTNPGSLISMPPVSWSLIGKRGDYLSIQISPQVRKVTVRTQPPSPLPVLKHNSREEVSFGRRPRVFKLSPSAPPGPLPSMVHTHLWLPGSSTNPPAPPGGLAEAARPPVPLQRLQPRPTWSTPRGRLRLAPSTYRPALVTGRRRSPMHSRGRTHRPKAAAGRKEGIQSPLRKKHFWISPLLRPRPLIGRWWSRGSVYRDWLVGVGTASSSTTRASRPGVGPGGDSSGPAGGFWLLGVRRAFLPLPV